MASKMKSGKSKGNYGLKSVAKAKSAGVLVSPASPVKKM